MSNRLEERLDRRDFMIASIATVGAAAALAGNAGSAKAQDTAASSGAGPVHQGTVYTGDVIQGKKVVSALDVNDLEPGRSTFCIFRAWRCPPDSTGMCP